MSDYGVRLLPVIEGSDGKAIPLYRFVQVIARLVDRDEMAEEQGLSREQVDSALAFIEQVAQAPLMLAEPPQDEEGKA